MGKPVPVVAINVEGVRVLVNASNFDASKHERWSDEGDAAPAASVKRKPGRPRKVRDAAEPSAPGVATDEGADVEHDEGDERSGNEGAGEQ